MDILRSQVQTVPNLGFFDFTDDVKAICIQ